MGSEMCIRDSGMGTEGTLHVRPEQKGMTLCVTRHLTDFAAVVRRAPTGGAPGSSAGGEPGALLGSGEREPLDQDALLDKGGGLLHMGPAGLTVFALLCIYLLVLYVGHKHDSALSKEPSVPDWKAREYDGVWRQYAAALLPRSMVS